MKISGRNCVRHWEEEKRRKKCFVPFCHGSHHLARGITAMHKTSSASALTSYASFMNNALGTQSRRWLILFMVCLCEKEDVENPYRQL